MTGPEHYRKAEGLMAQANRIMDGFPSDQYAQTMAEAQVHATLALAAATALNVVVDGAMPPADWGAWYQAAGTDPS